MEPCSKSCATAQSLTPEVHLNSRNHQIRAIPIEDISLSPKNVQSRLGAAIVFVNGTVLRLYLHFRHVSELKLWTRDISARE